MAEPYVQLSEFGRRILEINAREGITIKELCERLTAAGYPIEPDELLANMEEGLPRVVRPMGEIDAEQT